jgi:hypothetical protein
MKRLLFALLIVLFMAPAALAVTLAWDSGDPQWASVGVTGVRIYWDDDDATSPVKYADVPRPNNMATIDNVNFSAGKTYHFWCTAFTPTQESAASNVVTSTYSWQGTWGTDPGVPPKPNAPTLRLSTTTGGFVVPSSGIKTAP